MAFTAPEAFILLKRAYDCDRLAHAYLVTGPEGAGKHDLLRSLCGLILGASGDPFEHPDAYVLEPESKSRRIRVEAVRRLERELHMRSLRGGRKVGVLFVADRLVDQAANAFLKTLEEPPAHSHLFLVSSLPEQLPRTILSRCLHVQVTGVGRSPAPIEVELLAVLQEFAQRQGPDLARVFRLVRRFQELLADAKLRTQEETERAFKKDDQHYKQGGNKAALEEREESFKALAESRYIEERSRLLATLEQWWADVLHQQYSSTRLQYPDFASTTATIARRFTTPEILRRISAIETLRDHFSRNVQEQLAIEIAFTKAFAGEA